MWTLIIVFAFNTGLATSNVPGFKTAKVCEEKGRQILNDLPASALSITCIEVPKK